MMESFILYKDNTKSKMGVDNLPDQRVLFYHCTITSIYFAGTLMYLHFSDNLYDDKTYKFISILSTLVIVELVKLSFTNIQPDHFSVRKLDLNHSGKSKKSFLKNVKDTFKFILSITGITIIYYIAIVLFGAPLLTHQKETLMLAVTLTALTLTPASLHLGIDNALALFTGSPLAISGAFVDAVKLNIKAVLLGTWLSAFVLPLDWDRPWQAWPIPCVAGALLGYFAAHFITFIKISTMKLKKRGKRTDTLKSC